MPETEEQKDALRKILKLLSTAKDGSASENEIASAMRLARKLMDSHNLEEADIVDNEDAKKSTYDNFTETTAYERKGKLSVSMKILAKAVNALTDTSYYTAQQNTKIVFYGLPRDLAIATALYRELLATARAMTRLTCGDGWFSGHVAYFEGFTIRLRERAEEMKNSSISTGTGIILAKDALLNRFASEKLKLQSTTMMTKGHNNPLFYSGKNDANRVDLGKSGLTTSVTKPKLIS